MEKRLAWIAALMLSPLLSAAAPAQEPSQLRIATYNAALNRDSPGALIADLEGGQDAQAQKIAQIIQWIRPDILLLNEIDQDQESRAAQIFHELYLNQGQAGGDPIHYPYIYMPPVNTGIDSGFDLDGDGRLGGPGDAWGYGAFPGQYGFAVFSRLPLDIEAARQFQTLRWIDMPGALLTAPDPKGQNLTGPGGYYSKDAAEALRLSSKTHLDLPARIGNDIVHLLAAHPTPPVFDGPEDRNGKRNHDEIRFWADYIDGADWMVDDAGRAGGLAPGQRFVILGDLNADPFDGDSTGAPAKLLLEHPAILGSASDPAITPISEGALAAAENRNHKGDPRFDTADFGKRPGNLRVDYVLPSKNGLALQGSGVAWPPPEHPMAEAARASDHRLVWLDLEITPLD